MRFGIHALEVQEFLLAQRLTPVPLASPVIAGLINLRGQIITAVNMRTRLNLPPYGAEEQPFNIVIRSEKGVRSLLVDEIGDVVEIDLQTLENPTPSLPDNLRGLLSDVCKVGGSLLLITSSKAILDASSGPGK